MKETNETFCYCLEIIFHPLIPHNVNGERKMIKETKTERERERGEGEQKSTR